MLILLLLSNEAKAVPLDLCAHAGSGSLLGLGGQYLWEVDGTTDLEAAMGWSTLCSAGGPLAPQPTFLLPADEAVVNPGALAELAVSVDSGDPDGGWGRCSFFVEVDGQEVALPVRLPAGTRSRASLPWSTSQPVCAGVVSLFRLQTGVYNLTARVSDLYGHAGEVSTEIRVNEAPTLRMDAPMSGGAYLVGEEIPFELTLTDDVATPEGAVVYLDTFGVGGESTHAACVVDTAGVCSGVIAAPGAVGSFTLGASYVDVDGLLGQSAVVSLYANDVPGVVITEPLDGSMVEAGAGATIVVQVTDELAMPGDLVRILSAYEGGATGEIGTCVLETDRSCAFTFPSGLNGWYTLGAEYTDAWGEVGSAAPVAALLNDTPGLAVSGVRDGLILEPGTLSGIALSVDDSAPAAGELSVEVVDGASSSVFALGAPDAYGRAATSLDLAEIGTYTVTYTFTDEFGIAVSTEPMVVTTNYAPTVSLVSPASGEVVELPVPANDESTTYVYSFEVDDLDDAAITVQPAEGFDAFVECGAGTTGAGLWECTLDVSSWAPGRYTVSIVAADDVEEAMDSFVIDLVASEDFDYDGDGVLESEWIADGYGDCAPTDPTVHGASLDGSIAAAAEVCDELDNDCNGEVNDGLPDADDDTIDRAQPITGAVVVTSNGDTISDEGSLATGEDVDWWYFEVGVDGAGRDNAEFAVVLEVPGTGTGGVEGAWELGVWAQRLNGELLAYTPESSSPDCSTAATSGTCAMTWSVRSAPLVGNELGWYVGVSAADWSPEMCSESATVDAYFLTVSD